MCVIWGFAAGGEAVSQPRQVAPHFERHNRTTEASQPGFCLIGKVKAFRATVGVCYDACDSLFCFVVLY